MQVAKSAGLDYGPRARLESHRKLRPRSRPEGQQIAWRPIVLTRPDMAQVFHPDELCGDSHFTGITPDAASNTYCTPSSGPI